MNARTVSTFIRTFITLTYPGLNQHPPRFADPVAQGHGAGVSRIIGDNDLACRRSERQSAISRLQRRAADLPIFT
jgi:hypothetical protein